MTKTLTPDPTPTPNPNPNPTQALALVLVLIGGKALLEASGVEVPLSSRTHNYLSPNAACSHAHSAANLYPKPLVRCP